jgi:branched-chain amino acid aminotransferase
VHSKFVRGMSNESVAWVDGVWYDDAAEASVSVLDHGLLYGDGVFEGIRFYAATPFLAGAHLRRLRASARCLMIDVPFGDAEFVELFSEAIVRFGAPDGYLRLIVTRGAGAWACRHTPASAHDDPDRNIAAALPAELYERGVDVVTSSLRRASPDSVPPQIKSLNYLTSVLAAAEARSRGAHEALLLNAAGEISECTADNVFFAINGIVATPPVSAGGLEGITRGHVIGLLGADGIVVQERTLVSADAWTADEAFLTGTGAEVVPIASVDGRRLEAPGPITRRAQTLFANSLPATSAVVVARV